MSDVQLINKKFHILQRNKTLKDKEKFIYNEIAKRITNSLEGINLSLHNCFEIGYSSNTISEYVKSRFNEVSYTIGDISKDVLKTINDDHNKIILDHDNWTLNKNKFDIIISNFYLNNTNNFDNIVKNISTILNKNGFLIFTLPGKNCFQELKNSMIYADIELYNGAYRRFMDNLSINLINKSLKKHGLKMPVIDVDTIQLKYKKFSNLLEDIRYLGNSYMFFDKKKIFENKNYFNKIEEIYWKRFSNNNEIILQLEILYISCWK